jgi:hypothetical protein
MLTCENARNTRRLIRDQEVPCPNGTSALLQTCYTGHSDQAFAREGVWAVEADFLEEELGHPGRSCVNRPNPGMATHLKLQAGLWWVHSRDCTGDAMRWENLRGSSRAGHTCAAESAADENNLRAAQVVALP